MRHDRCIADLALLPPRTPAAAGLSITLTSEQVASLPPHVQAMVHDFCPGYDVEDEDGVSHTFHDVLECGFNAMDITWLMNSSADVSHIRGATQLRQTVKQASGTDIVFRYPNFRAEKGGILAGEQLAWPYDLSKRAAAEQR
jgi:hypothetical protein